MNESKLIEVISKNSDEVGHLLVKFLQQYKLIGLKDATTSQLKEFINKNKLQTED